MQKYEGNQGRLVEEVAEMMKAEPALGGINQAFGGPTTLVVTGTPEAVARVKAFLEQKKNE
jgi:malonyl CoA-acyl carrier protein transacylase